MPRVAIVAASLDIIGGQGIQARALMDQLSGEGVDIAFVAVNPRFPLGLGWVRRVPLLRTLLNELLYLPNLIRLRPSDVVHVFSASYWSFLLGPAPAMLAGRLLRKRVVLNYHSGEAGDHLARWGVLVHPWLRLAHEIVVPSRYLEDVFARHGYRTRVIQNVVDLSSLPYRERRRLRPRLLSTRNLEPHYGVDVILRAYALVKARFAGATLVVAGSGGEERALGALAISLGIDGVRFVGRQEPADMAALYADADIFVNASTVDNQPVSVLEAFAAGLPVISTGTGDLANMLGPGECGVVVPAGNPAALAAAVTWLMEHPAAVTDMTRAARAKADAHTWPRVRAAWQAVYEPERPARTTVAPLNVSDAS